MGGGHRRLPDRGRRQRRRPRPLRVGRLLAHPRQGRQRAHRRRRLRPLPPRRGRRGHDGRARSAVLPLLDLVVAGAARGPRQRQRRRDRLVLPARRSAARARHRAVSHTVPLGPPVGTRADRRLPQPRHRQVVLRLRRTDGERARRPGVDVGHVQRAVVLRLPRARRRASTPPVCTTTVPPSPWRTTSCSPTGWASRRCGPSATTSNSGSSSTPTLSSPRGRRRRPAIRSAVSTRSTTGGGSMPCSTGAYPTDILDDFGPLADADPAGRQRADRPADRLARHQLLLQPARPRRHGARRQRRPATTPPSPTSPSRRSVATTPTWDGRSPPMGSPSSWCD